MNSKICKELRRIVEEAAKPGTPIERLLSKPVKLKDGRRGVVAIQSKGSLRGAYRNLKAAVEKNPEILEQLRATANYRKMIAAEKAAGGPTFENVTYPMSSTEDPQVKAAQDAALNKSMEAPK